MKNLFFIFVLSVVAFSCSPDSKITSTWKSAKRTRSYHDLVVVALTKDANAQAIVENDLAAALAKKNIVVNKGLDVFPPAFEKDVQKGAMLEKVKKIGADAIVTVSLLNKATQNRFVPGYAGYSPGFYGYYNYWAPTVYSPGYYAQDRVYYIETNVYDAVTDELVWSAQTETYNPSSVTGFSKDLGNLLANKLEKDNVIRPFFEPGPHGKVTSRP